MDNAGKIFYERVKVILDQKGINVYQFEKQNCISNGSLGKYREGIAMPTISSVVRIAKALGVEPSVLIDGIE